MEQNSSGKYLPHTGLIDGSAPYQKSGNRISANLLMAVESLNIANILKENNLSPGCNHRRKNSGNNSGSVHIDSCGRCDLHIHSYRLNILA